MLLTFTEFIGRFHPVLVHMPIGILLFACFCYLLASIKHYAWLHTVVSVMVFWGAITAVASCLTGLLLASGGGYEEALISQHQWMGIGVAILSIGFYFLHRSPVSAIILKTIAFTLIVGIGITGHLGGSITHGSDYLTSALGNKQSANALKPIPDIQHALVYKDIVQPLLEARCYACHGSTKQKGDLRLDSRERMLKGGENGPVLLGGKPDESEMIERLLLPLENDKRMPPKGKPKLTEHEISVLRWWVASGADFEKKVADFKQDEKIKKTLLALESGAPSSTLADAGKGIPENSIQPADTAAIGLLRKVGVVVSQVRQNSNYLSVNFVAAEKSDNSVIKLLEPLRKHIVSLKLDHSQCNDEAMKIIGDCKELRILNLAHTQITDKGLAFLQSLEQLQSLNLNGVRITAKGLQGLKKLKNLKFLYLYQTPFASVDWAELKKSFPLTSIDSGNYFVPILPTDTTIVELKKN